MRATSDSDRDPAEQVADAASSLAERAKEAVRKVADAHDGDQVTIPGAPAAEPPPVAEPVEPRGPLPATPDQKSPRQVSATGKEDGAQDRSEERRVGKERRGRTRAARIKLKRHVRT